MNFNLCRHIRIAGTVIVFVGFFLSNTAVVLFGNVVVAIGYMMSISKMEQILEKSEEKGNE